MNDQEYIRAKEIKELLIELRALSKELKGDYRLEMVFSHSDKKGLNRTDYPVDNHVLLQVRNRFAKAVDIFIEELKAEFEAL